MNKRLVKIFYEICPTTGSFKKTLVGSFFKPTSCVHSQAREVSSLHNIIIVYLLQLEVCSFTFCKVLYNFSKVI